MKALLILTIFFSVVTNGAIADGQGRKLTAFSGGSIIVKCHYKEELRDNKKFFCKGEKTTCQFNKLSEKRLTLYDTNNNYFLVLVRNLTAKDSGTYQCLVEQKTNEHTYKAFNLEVKEDSCCGNAITKSGNVGESIEISCKYPSHMSKNSKEFYKEHHTRILSDISQPKQRLEDSVLTGTYKVTMNNLTLADAGVYWCAVGTGGNTGSCSLLTEVTLLVFDPKQPPTTSLTNLDSSQPTNNQPPLGNNILPIVSVTLVVLVTGLIGVVYYVCVKRRSLAGKREHKNSPQDDFVYEEINDTGCPSDLKSSTTDPPACPNYTTVTFHKREAESLSDPSSAVTPKVEMTSEYATIQTH